jgi:hypothetical protein
MTHRITENLAETQEVSERYAVPALLSRAGLLVTECVPNGYCLDRFSRPRANHVSRATEALALPWIEKLPGEKRIKFLHGQVFVVQDYLGSKLIRAHISHAERCWETPRKVPTTT